MLRSVLMDPRDALRDAAIAYVRALADRSSGLVRRRDLEAFSWAGSTIRLIAPQQGIWTPSGFGAALSIVTAAVRPNERPPYEDEIGPDNYPRYKWRGSDPQHHDNRMLRRAMEEQKPLIWFVGIVPGVFRPYCPVWLADEEPAQQQFVVALDPTMLDAWDKELVLASPFNPARRYAKVLVDRRLHQRAFRDRVLLAYSSQCALCRLRHVPLLDAAHIKRDSDGGEPVVTNGLAMCVLHHRAFDADVLAVRPDYKVEVRSDVLAEIDGPTLQYALQGLHGDLITLPRRRIEHPDPILLEERYERFRSAV
jgi:putative restriction endonuclease